MNLSGKRVVIVGASGKIGRSLAYAVRGAGAMVTGAARFRNPEIRNALQRDGIESVVYDAKEDDPSRLPEADLVFLEIWAPDEHHGAGAAEAIWKLNYEGVGRIVERYRGVADIINGSSGIVYGTSIEPFSEDDRLRPNSEYGLARFAQERLIDFLCDRTASRVIHLRYFFGNTPDSGQLYRAARAIRDGRELEGLPEQKIQVIALEDFVRCTLRSAELLERADSQAINICHPEVFRRRELAERIRTELGEGRVVFRGSTGGAEVSLTGDPGRMLELLGPPSIGVDELIRRAVRAARQAPAPEK